MKNSLQTFLILMALLPALAACCAPCPRCPAPTATTVYPNANGGETIITPPGHATVVEPAD
jgi:hypothetical protein